MMWGLGSIALRETHWEVGLLSSGERLGPFTVVRQLGEGGMGQTYLCVRPDIDQHVCAKVIKPELRGQPETVELFQREALLTLSLRHPGIAAVVAVDDKVGFVAFEYIDGCDLRRLLSAWRFDPETAVYVLLQVSKALEYAHARRVDGRSSPIIHRDVSPGNLMVDRWGNVKLIDFGVAKALTEGPSRFLSIKGKLTYMSPEQATAGALDGRSDQYSLGVVAYEMLAGERPHDGRDDRETLAKLLIGQHEPITNRVPGLPAGLGAIVERMLAIDADRRFASMSELLDALSEFAPGPMVYRALAQRVNEALGTPTASPEHGPLDTRGGLTRTPLRTASHAYPTWTDHTGSDAAVSGSLHIDRSDITATPTPLTAAALLTPIPSVGPTQRRRRLWLVGIAAAVAAGLAALLLQPSERAERDAASPPTTVTAPAVRNESAPTVSVSAATEPTSVGAPATRAMEDSPQQAREVLEPLPSATTASGTPPPQVPMDDSHGQRRSRVQRTKTKTTLSHSKHSAPKPKKVAPQQQALPAKTSHAGEANQIPPRTPASRTKTTAPKLEELLLTVGAEGP